MDYKELKNLSDKQLREELTTRQATLQELRFKAANGQLKNVRQVLLTRQVIARILTALKQRAKVDQH